MTHTPGGFDAQLDAREDVHRLFGRRAPLFVSVAAALFGACGIIFTWLQVFDLTLSAAINNTRPDTLTRIALIIYYNAWLWAQPVEFSMSLKVYIAAPDRGRIPRDFFIILPSLVAAGLLLFFVAGNSRYVSYALALFWLIDVFLWQRVRIEAAKWRDKSAEIYRKEDSLVRLEQLRCYVDRYLRGNWQYFRFFVMALMLLVILVIANSDYYRSFVASYLNAKFGDIPVEKWSLFLPGMLIFIYILVGETSSWAYRIRAVHQIHFLDDLRERYALKSVMQPA